MKKTPLCIAAAALVASLGAHAATPAALLGDIAAPESATRTIVITPTTQFVNVVAGETVKFVESGHEFAVSFDGVRASFDLNALAPEGSLDHKVLAYVPPNQDLAD